MLTAPSHLGLAQQTNSSQSTQSTPSHSLGTRPCSGPRPEGKSNQQHTVLGGVCDDRQ